MPVFLRWRRAAPGSNPMRLWVYAVRRIVVAIPVILGIVTVLFVLVSSLPSQQVVCSFGAPSGKFSPCTSQVPCPSNPAQLCPNPAYQSAFNALGLNQPAYVQWFIFVGNTLTFHWGYVSQGSGLGVGVAESGLPSLVGQPVSSVVAQFLPYSLELLGLTMLFTLLVVVPVQRRARASPGGVAERVARALTLPGYGIPLFLVGTLAFLGSMAVLGGAAAASPICPGNSVFQDFWGSWPTPPCPHLYGTANLGPFQYPAWLILGYRSTPTGFPTLDAALHGDGWLALDTLFRMTLPALVLAFVGVAVVLRYVRYTPYPNESFEHLRAARGRGLPESEVADRLAGRSSLAEVASGLGPAMVMILGMLPVVEIIFNLWGVGQLFTLSIVGGSNSWDFGVLYGTLLTCTLIVFVVCIVMDLVRAWLDPRSRAGTLPVRILRWPSSEGSMRSTDPASTL